MKQKKALLVINPSSGKWRNESAHRRVEARLRKMGYDVRVCVSSRQGDVRRYVLKNGATQDVIVCSGGDGTYHEIIGAMIEGGIAAPVCHLPHGTANDMAHTLDLPRGEARRLALIEEGCLLPCDAGHVVGGDDFAYVAAFGAMAALSYSTPREAKRRYGFMAYLFEGIRALRRLEGYHATVQCDDRVYQGKYVMGCVCNTTSLARFIRLPRTAVSLSDGRLEVMLIRYPENLWDLLNVVRSLLTRRMDGKHIVLEHVERCTFSLAELTPWTLDGEEMGRRAEVTIHVRPRAFVACCGLRAAGQGEVNAGAME